MKNYITKVSIIVVALGTLNACLMPKRSMPGGSVSGSGQNGNAETTVVGKDSSDKGSFEGATSQTPPSEPAAPDATPDASTRLATPPAPCEIWRCQNTIAVTPGFYPTYHQPNCPGTITLLSGTIEHGATIFKITHNAGGTGYFYANNPASEQIAGYPNDALTAPTVTCNNGTVQ